jgi:hypothetical protein
LSTSPADVCADRCSLLCRSSARRALAAALLPTIGLVGGLLGSDPSAVAYGNAGPVQHRSTGNGAQIADDPVLLPSERIALAVPGFRPAVRVTVRIACLPAMLVSPMRGRDGVLRVEFAVPSHLSAGQHLLAFAGPGRSSTVQHRPPGSVVASVPEVAFFPFRVAHGGNTMPTVACR